MLNILNYNSPLLVNGIEYPSSQAAAAALAGFSGDVEIIIGGQKANNLNEQQKPVEVENKTYKISVRQYMTKPASPGFDFMKKWNNNLPMPLRTMVGEKLEETKGMYKMRLHGAPIPTAVCIKCGRHLTNPVSVLYGIGPECGGHFSINPYETEEELKAHFNELRERMQEITWEGWVIKSAITDMEEIM